MQKILCLMLCVLLFGGSAFAAELPDEAQLSADRMRFDSKSGDFLATGNVLIHADGLVVAAPRGTGNVKNKEVHFTEGVTASGDWQGDWVNLEAGSISLYFAQTPTYTIENGVKGDVGRVSIDADKLYMKGSDISALTVRRLQDHETGVVFGAEDVRGTLLNGVLQTMTAKSKVWIQGRPNDGGDMVDIRGDNAVYSVERGSVVMTGNVRAVQKGRTLTSRSVVYFPANNRIEAIGGLTGKGDNADTDRATITIDLKQEKERQGNK